MLNTITIEVKIISSRVTFTRILYVEIHRFTKLKQSCRELLTTLDKT